MNTFSKTADRQGQAAGNAVPGRGKTRVCALFTACLLSSGSAFAGDPCKSVLCMFGKFTGNSGGSECRSAEQDYFSILVKKHGNIKWSQTATARQDYPATPAFLKPGFGSKLSDDHLSGSLHWVRSAAIQQRPST